MPVVAVARVQQVVDASRRRGNRRIRRSSRHDQQALKFVADAPSSASSDVRRERRARLAQGLASVVSVW